MEERIAQPDPSLYNTRRGHRILQGLAEGRGVVWHFWVVKVVAAQIWRRETVSTGVVPRTRRSSWRGKLGVFTASGFTPAVAGWSSVEARVLRALADCATQEIWEPRAHLEANASAPRESLAQGQARASQPAMPAKQFLQCGVWRQTLSHTKPSLCLVDGTAPRLGRIPD